MHHVVVTAGTAIGSVLALAEALRTSIGCDIYVLCTHKATTEIIASSRFVTEAFYIDHIEDSEYVGCIQKWYAAKDFSKKPVLYSTTDTSCFLIDKDRDWFEHNFLLSLPSSKIIKEYTKKGLAEVAAEKAGLAVPKTVILDKNIDLYEALSGFHFPVILKPRATYLKGGLDFKIKVIESLESLEEFITDYLQDGNEVLCQEYIEGNENSAYFYVFYRGKEGSIISSMGIKTLQSTSKGGVMLKGKSSYSHELDVICRKFLDEIGYVGIGGIEFKEKNGVFYFIEMSVRLEGFYKIAEVSNVPISYSSYQNLVYEAPVDDVEQVQNIVYVSLLPTIINRIKNKMLIKAFAELLGVIFKPKWYINVFSAKSPTPFLKEIYLTLFRRK